MTSVGERALIAVATACRAFADAIGPTTPDSQHPPAPEVGSADSMFVILEGVAKINERAKRGVRDDEARSIARAAGIDFRGTAGYYGAGLLRMDEEGDRWLTDLGRERLAALRR